MPYDERFDSFNPEPTPIPDYTGGGDPSTIATGGYLPPPGSITDIPGGNVPLLPPPGSPGGGGSPGGYIPPPPGAGVPVAPPNLPYISGGGLFGSNYWPTWARMLAGAVPYAGPAFNLARGGYNIF